MSVTKKRRERPDNSGSTLLTRQENQFLFETLGADRVSLAAAVVQLLRASGGAWLHEHVGVVSLVKDYQRKEYALKLYDIYKGTMLWEQPLYKGFRAKSYFHCRKLLSFEADRCIYGLNFSDDQEAANLKYHLEKRYEQEAKTQKPLPSGSPARPPSSTHPKFQSPGITDVGSVPPVTVNSSTTSMFLKKNVKTAKEHKNKKKTKIRKEDIGLPTNFTHKVHVGWDVESGFCREVLGDAPLDENVKRLLQVAPIAANSPLPNPPPAHPPVPAHPPLPSHPPVPAHPPLPAHPPAHPPPPPAPPLPNSTTSSTPAAPPTLPAPAADERANLLAQIQAGAKLKHIKPPPERSPLGAVVGAVIDGNSASGNGRDEMMQQIKAGAQLKHVDQGEAENRKSNVQEIGGIAGALARALEERRKNINNTDESENSDSSNSDWSED